MAYVNTANAHTSFFIARIGTAFDALATRYKQYRLYRNALNELSELSNRELADLGLSRASLRSVAYEAAYL